MDFYVVLVGLGIGLLSGLIAGMLGMAGGIVIVPALVLLLGMEQHVAQGVSLAVVVATAAVGTFVHFRGGYVQGRITAMVAPSAVLFAFVGAQTAGLLDASVLRLIFASVLLVVGVRMLLVKGGATD